MSASPSGNGGDPTRGAGSAAIKGALLIGLAILVGVFLLNRVDDTDSGAQVSTNTTKPKTTTTKPTQPTQPAASTTVPRTTPVKSPAQLRIIVLNGGAASGAAKTLRDSLVKVGYTNQPQANNWSGHTQKGKSLLCKPGLAQESVALSQQTALQGAKVDNFPTPPPAVVTSDIDCIVVVGS
jgi:hypothetical protein